MSNKNTSKVILSLIAVYVVFIFASGLFAQDRQEKYFEETGSKPAAVADEDLKDAKSAAVKEADQPRQKMDLPKRWRVEVTTGYEYDDNVRLASSIESFRPGEINTSAGRYSVDTNFAYDVYRDQQHRLNLKYSFYRSFHDDGLDEFNYTNNDFQIEGRKVFMAFDRPSQVALRYNFSHGILDNDTFSSSHFWTLFWAGEWAENWVLTVYDRLGTINFRDKGFQDDISSRDGFYQQTGFMQTFLFDERKRSISAGYELSLANTTGKNFDKVEHGVRAIFKTPVIEKIDFKGSFFFQFSDYYNFVVSPQRKDLRYFYEFRLSRPFGEHMIASAFYKRTDVHNVNQGVLGQFSYERNIGGGELSFIY